MTPSDPTLVWHCRLYMKANEEERNVGIRTTESGRADAMRGRNMSRTLASLFAVLALLVAACGGDGSADTTAAQDTDTTASEASDTTMSEDTDTTVAESGVCEEAMAREDEWVVQATGPGVFLDGREVDFTVAKMPVVRAAVSMRDQGWNARVNFIEANETAVQAVVQGDADAGNIALPTVLAAVSGGAPFKVFGGSSRFGFTIVGDLSIEGPDDADGIRLAYQAPISAGTLTARLWTLNSDAEPQAIVMPGSSTRVEALYAGELDAAAVSPGFHETVEEERPGEFGLLYNPIDEYPFLIDTVLFYDETAMDDQLRCFLEVFQAEHALAVRELRANPEILEEWKEFHQVPVSPSPETTAELYFDDVGATADAINQQIELMVATEQIESADELPSGEELIDPSIWDEGASALADEG